MSEREAEKRSSERWNVKKVRSEMSDGAKESNEFLLVELVVGLICHHKVRSATATTRSEDIAEKILYSIESEMRMCPYTLRLGELNLEYDAICKPSELHCLKRSPYDQRRCTPCFKSSSYGSTWRNRC